MIKIPKKVQLVVEALENAGHSAYIVGGCVRDLLLMDEPKDFDVTTSATPCEVKGLFARTIDIGIKHGTVAVIVKGEKIEVTTFRVDGLYLDGRRPESVSFTKSIQEDLSRRDFTINAIAYNPRTGFCDPFDGRKDIQSKLIRCVGDASERFNEDALRMVRAVRFAATLGFRVDEKIIDCISLLKNKLSLVSIERINEETRKLLLGDFSEALAIAEHTGILPYMLVGGSISTENLPSVISQIKICPFDYPMRLALLLNGICKNNRAVLLNSKLAGKVIKTVQIYLAYLHTPLECDKYKIKKILRDVPVEIFDNLLVLKEIVSPSVSMSAISDLKREIVEAGEIYSLKNLAVKGEDLIAIGIEPGKHMGQILEDMLDQVMRCPEMNEKGKLLERWVYEQTFSRDVGAGDRKAIFDGKGFQNPERKLPPPLV